MSIPAASVLPPRSMSDALASHDPELFFGCDERRSLISRDVDQSARGVDV